VRQRSPELALLVGLAGCVLLLGGTLPVLETIRDRLAELADRAGVSSALLGPVGKTVGLSIVTRLSASLCREAGEESVAVFVELADSAAAVVIALPLLELVLQLVKELL
jgi:stage III sporulation protein AD